MASTTTYPAFNILNDAAKITDEIWQAAIPAFLPESVTTSDDAFKDDHRVFESTQILAELIFYHKSRIESPGKPPASEWIRKTFESRTPQDFLHSLQPILVKHFGELLTHGHWIELSQPKVEDGVRRGTESGNSKIKKEDRKNTLYMSGYGSTPDPKNIESFLVEAGVDKGSQPHNVEYLLKIYHRLYIKQERLISIAHLLMSGAQSDLQESKKSLENELLLQERLKEYRASYLIEYSTTMLAFSKRHFGLTMLGKLNLFSGLKEKHELVTRLIAERISVGSDQYPQIIKSTKKVQHAISIIGQALVGGFLATEILHTLLEWTFVYFHRSPYAFVTGLSKIIQPASSIELNELAEQFHFSEMIGIYVSTVTVAGVVGVVLYLKFTNRAHAPTEAHHDAHH